mmetsp:Transcript_13933/g.30101  ORF Transcript_13933/g.30101 Transcript_13933/m.30101 type:complete len:383 (-) Transcript_13933:482-1630(-)
MILLQLAKTMLAGTLGQRSLLGLLSTSSTLSCKQLHAYATESRAVNGGTVGFIGVGAMGHHMAANLLKAGVQLLVYDRSTAALQRLLATPHAAGRARAVNSPRELAETQGVSAVITMLPATDHVREAYQGPEGLLKARGGLIPGLLLDCSTICPTYTQQLGQEVARTQRRADPALDPQHAAAPPAPHFVDAPVSGGVPGAANATLTFMCGGPDEVVEATRPLLALMGSRVLHMGSRHGAGQVAKLCNNLACGIEMAAVSEALALGAAAGLDPTQLSQVFNTSSARCWSSEAYNPCPGVMPGVPASSGYRGGFSAALMLKDLRLALQLAADTGQRAPMGEQASALYGEVVKAVESGAASHQGGIPDFAAIYKLVYKGRDAKEQ